MLNITKRITVIWLAALLLLSPLMPALGDSWLEPQLMCSAEGDTWCPG